MDRIASRLKPLGYRKSGASFLRDCGDVILVVQLQKSQKTTPDTLVVTLNLGIFSRVVASRIGRLLTTPTIVDCHWQERIGFLMPERYDKWWSASTEAEACTVAEELDEALHTFGLPALEQISSTDGLRALWASGEGPGLTELERERYLKAVTG